MSDKLYLQIGNKKIEAKGEQLEELLQAQTEALNEYNRIEAEQQAKEEARQSAMSKLKALGLTDDEISALVP